MRRALLLLTVVVTRALCGAAIGAVLWLLMTAFAELIQTSTIASEISRPDRKVHEYTQYRGSPDYPLPVVKPGGISSDALVVLREIIADHVSAGQIDEALEAIERTKDDLTKDFLLMEVVSHMLSETLPSHPSLLLKPSPEEERISVLQNWIAVNDKGNETLRNEMNQLAAATILFGSSPRTGSLSVVSCLIQGKIWASLNLQEHLRENAKTLPLLRRELADKLAAKEAAKQAAEKSESEAKQRTENTVSQAEWIADKIGNNVYKAEAFRTIANAQRRLNPHAPNKSLEKAVTAALNAPRHPTNWWENRWLWILGGALGTLVITFLNNLAKPIAESYGTAIRSRINLRAVQNAGEGVLPRDNPGAYI